MATKQDFTLRERGAMLTLMAEARLVANTELKERFRVTLTKASREKLARLGLIEVGVGVSQLPMTAQASRTSHRCRSGPQWPVVAMWAFPCPRFASTS